MSPLSTCKIMKVTGLISITLQLTHKSKLELSTHIAGW